MLENETPKIKCKFCNKSIRRYKKWKDWANRDSHYSCWKEDEQWGYLKKYRLWKDDPKNNIEKI